MKMSVGERQPSPLTLQKVSVHLVKDFAKIAKHSNVHDSLLPSYGEGDFMRWMQIVSTVDCPRRNPCCSGEGERR